MFKDQQSESALKSKSMGSVVAEKFGLIEPLRFDP
jgi:hypothetical protein